MVSLADFMRAPRDWAVVGVERDLIIVKQEVKDPRGVLTH